MTAMFLVLAACCFGGAAFLALETLARPRRELQRSIARVGSYGRIRDDAIDQGERERERPLARLSEPAARLVLRLSPRTTFEQVDLRLATAGLASRIAASEFLALKLAFGAGGAVFATVIAASGRNFALGLLLVFTFALAGFFLPDWLVRVRVSARQEAVRVALPNALDLLAVTVEAGLGLPAAIARLTETTKGPLSDEFALALGQMSIGESRPEALKRMAARVGVPELTAFVRAVVQADQLGVSMGKTLRIQAAEARLRRQALAEERAQKAPIKMLFPTAIFIFPTIFIVTLGPALLSIVKMF